MDESILLEPVERAAEQAAELFQSLSDADKIALHVRLLAIGAIRSGDPNGFLDTVFEATVATIKAFAAQHMDGDADD